MKTTLKTLITNPAYFDKDAIAAFEAFSTVTVKQFSRVELLQHIANYHILVIRVDTKIDKELISHAKNLKVIATATIGTDHIDLAFTKEKGIQVFSLQGVNTTATAEHAFALMLSLIRKIPAAHHSLLDGKWDRASFIGTQLFGKKLGVVGFGRIGREIALRAQAFGMQILAYDPYLKEEDFTKNNATKMELNLLLQEADIITLHVLLTDETRGFINAQRLALLKPTAVLLNCSRGEVIVEEDLVFALQHKKIAGAALDVFSSEPLSKENVLVSYAKNHDTLLLTPHIGGSTFESIHQAGLAVAAQTKAFFDKHI